MQHFTIRVEFAVFCACGEGLCQQSTAEDGNYYSGRKITVTPCQKCLAQARQEAIDSYKQEEHHE